MTTSRSFFDASTKRNGASKICGVITEGQASLIPLGSPYKAVNVLSLSSRSAGNVYSRFVAAIIVPITNVATDCGCQYSEDERNGSCNRQIGLGFFDRRRFLYVRQDVGISWRAVSYREIDTV